MIAQGAHLLSENFVVAFKVSVVKPVGPLSGGSGVLPIANVLA